MPKKRRFKHRATSDKQLTNDIRTRVLHAELDEQRERESMKNAKPEQPTVPSFHSGIWLPS